MCSQEGAACTITKEGKDFKNAYASIRCPACMEGHKFRGNVTYLTEPIDIYSDWIDFIANPTAKKRTMLIAPKPKVARTDFEEEEDEDHGARKFSSAAQASKKQPTKSSKSSSSSAKSGKKKIVQEDDSEEEEFDNEESEVEETRPRSAQADDDDDEEEYF